VSESTLALQYKQLLAAVGAFLGFGRGEEYGQRAWTDQERLELEGCVASGLRQFYYPPLPDGEGFYDWSFLRPTATLTLAASGRTIRLPDDFGGCEGEISFTASGVNGWYTLRPTGVGVVDERYATNPTTTGRPQYVSVRPVRGTTHLRGQRSEMHVWPVSDAAYTFTVPYYVHPDILTAQVPYPLGGPAHAETILESCLSIAEQHLDDAAGIHTAKFGERLRASIGLDRRLRPALIGYNRDLSDTREFWPTRNLDGRVTVNGVQP
jgi:hypothetical protein